MATSRPVKKWLVPLLAVLIGLSAGFIFFPSHQEYQYRNWVKTLEDLENGHYRVDTEYRLDEENGVTTSNGYWSAERATYGVSTPVTDGTDFTFDVYMEGERFFVHSADEWVQGESSHPIWNELSPLDNPFQWSRDILQNADETQRIDKGEGQTTYEAVFHSLNEFDFRGTSLQDQEDTHLTMELAEGRLQSISFHAKPIRPEELSPFDSYPDEFTYDMFFEEHDEEVPPVPGEALQAESLD